MADPGHKKRIEGKRWAISCLIIFFILGFTLTYLIPTLQLTPDRIIFRPTPSCSTFNNPTRYLAFILDENNNQVFYVTTVRGVNNTDPSMKEAAPFYIVSSWIRSPNHFRITSEKVEFQPATVQGVSKVPYNLSRGYCIRAAGPTSSDPLYVAFYSLNGTEKILLDTGYISKSDLEEFHFGWFLVSNCRTIFSRWLWHCKTGYVSSTYVRLPEYARMLLLEDAESMSLASDTLKNDTPDSESHEEASQEEQGYTADQDISSPNAMKRDTHGGKQSQENTNVDTDDRSGDQSAKKQSQKNTNVDTDDKSRDQSAKKQSQKNTDVDTDDRSRDQSAKKLEL